MSKKLSEQERLNIFAMLLQGDEPKDVAAQCDTSYATIIKMKRELEEAQAKDDINSLVNLEEAVINELVMSAKAAVPAEMMQAAEEAVEGVVENLGSLELLSKDVHKTALTMSTKIRKMTIATSHVSDIVALADSLCKIQNAFFVNNTPQLNVQNNYGSNQPNSGQQQYGTFLNDKPADK